MSSWTVGRSPAGRPPRPPARHPAQVTAGRLVDHAAKWTRGFTGAERDAIDVVVRALREIAEAAAGHGRLHVPARAPGQSITCPRCGATSFHPDDVAEGYCGQVRRYEPPTQGPDALRSG